MALLLLAGATDRLPAAPDDAGPEPAAASSIAPDALRSVFVIRAGDRRGLGFLADDSGLIVTAREVVGRMPHAVVEVDGEHRFFAQILALEAESEAAVLRVAPEAVADLQPLTLVGETVPLPRKKDRLTVVRPGGPEAPVVTQPSRVRRANERWIVREEPLPAEAVGGPILDPEGLVLGVDARPPGHDETYARAVPAGAVRTALRRARDLASGVAPPPAEVLPPAGSVAATLPAVGGASAGPVDPAAYRVRSEDTSIEFVTPRLVRSLGDHPPSADIVGEAPWLWRRFGPLDEPAVVVQVVPDLRWTGGSYARVTGRVVSYPILAGVVAGLTLFFGLMAAVAGASDMPDFITPTAPLWKPVHAAYRFKGGFQEARLLRDGVLVPPIGGRTDCATMEAHLTRKRSVKPRDRTVRGCWGAYAYPVEAFAPDAALELHLYDEEDRQRPRVVSLPADLIARLRSDFAAPPRTGAPEETDRAALDGHEHRNLEKEERP